MKGINRIRNQQPTLATDKGRILSPTVVPADAPVAVRGLTVSYGEKPAVFSVDATFPAGAMSAIIGPNGAGKSTLLKAILGVTPRLSGDVFIFGQPIEQVVFRMSTLESEVNIMKQDL